MNKEYPQRYVDALNAEIAKLRADKRRLDYLEKNQWTVTWNERHCGFVVQLPWQVVGNIAHGRLREALDTAIEIAPEYAATMQELQKQSTL